MLGRLPFGRRWLSPACAVLFAAVPAGAVTKVGCVGDSITAGYGLSSTDQAYPSRLGVLLGSGYEVKNYGESGAAVSKASDKPYWSQPSYAASTQYDADIVVIMLGTNDAKPSNWSLGTFTADYSALVQHYLDLGAKVFLATPPPVFDPGAYSIDPHTLNDLVVADVRQMAADLGSLPLIDVYAALDGQSSLFPDTVHPNAAGAQLIANTVGAAILAAAGGNGGAGGGNGGAAGSSASAGGGAGGLSPAGGAGGVFESGGRAPVGGQGAGGAAANAGGAAGSGIGAGGTGGRATGGASGGERAGAPGNGAGGDATAGSLGAAGSSGVGAVGGAGAGRGSGVAGVSDEAAGEASSSDDSGCGCRTAAVHGSPRWRWAWLALAAVAVAARRRTRRTRR